MTSFLSPAESLGLSGAALDSRLKNAARHVTDDTFLRIAERLRSDAIAEEVVYERDGERDAVRVMLRPLLAHRDQLTYVHLVCLRITEALRRLPELFIADAEIRKIIALNPEEERWLREIWTPDHGRNNAVYGRLDAVCDFASAAWQDTLKFMEPNLSGVGGIHYGPIAERLIMRDVVPELLEHDPGLVIELPQDQRDLFAQLLIDQSRAIGRDASQLCFVEPKYEHDGPDEQSSLSRYLSEKYGLTITHADPRELEIRDGEVYYENVRVDVVYRDYEMRDLIALEKELGRPLDAMRLLFRKNRVVSSPVGDLDHKSGFEILTDRALAEKLFSPDDCRLFHRHVLWTRLVADRRTTLPDNTEGDLLDHMRRHRDQLVLKPNRAYGGEGVAIGAAMKQEDWEKLVDDAAAKGADPELSWVVQAATRLPVAEFPVVGPQGRVHNEPFYVVMGFAPTDNGLGTMCRVSQKQVVNVAQHGGMAALLVAELPGDLRIPRRPVKAPEDVGDSLRKHIVELRNLEQAIALLEWDEETQLPIKGQLQRGEQIGALETIHHAALVSDRLGDLIEDAAAAGGNSDLARELFLLKRERNRALAIPSDLIRNFANAKSQALGGWEEARKTGEFGTFASPFSQLLDLVRERAECLASGKPLYDTFLDEFEPGMTSGRIAPLLGEMREKLTPLVRATAESARSRKDAFGGACFPTSAQWALSRRVLSAMGFDFERGRLDRSSHPFTMMAGADDVRVTSRTDEADFSSCLLATVHEGGHALYDQGFAAKDRDTLLADGASSGMHEGQARLWENHVGRSRAFMEFLAPSLRELFPDIPANVDAIWKAVNAVRPGGLRVDADEMSYHLHIALRFELETALISGDLAVSALPDAWNTRSQEFFGHRPTSDREGALQDVHWAVGMFGYFPTYTIGSLYAAQLVETYRATNDLDAQIRKGDFAPLRNWLAANIHQVGNRASAEEIITKATGRGLGTAAYFAHIASPARAWNAV